MMRRVLRPVLIAGLGVVCLGLGYLLGLRQAAVQAPAGSPLSAEDQRAFGVVWEALGQIEHDYYRRTELDHQKLAEGAARGLVEAVGDPYTRLGPPGEPDPAAAALRGSTDGVGLRLARADGQLRVVAPLAGSPAERAGLAAGDAIVAIDGTDASQLTPAEAQARLDGPRGTSVSLELERAGVRQTLTLVRERVTVAAVAGQLLPGDARLAYVRLPIFGDPTASQLHQTLAGLLDAGARGVVLDLRGNPGGYLNSAVDVASTFLRDSLVLYQQADGQRTPYRTVGRPQVPDLPLAVLVDGGSASAAEIVAAALHEHGRAVVIGQRTFGKGTVQETRSLTDAAELHITVAQWLTASGQSLQDQGLQPDLEVAPADGHDAPLEAAMAQLGTQTTAVPHA
jgi:carboxyl-terminal processing protease